MKNPVLPIVLPKQSGRVFLLVALAVLIVLPVLCAPHLLLLDAPAHEVRLAVLHDMLFGNDKTGFYNFNTLFLPNIAFDVIGLGLSLFVSPEGAGRIFFSLTLLLTWSGIAILNRVAIRRWSIIPFASILLLYNLISILGFFSYAFGLALVPWALACRLKLEEYPQAVRFLLGATLGILLLFCHVFDFGIYTVMSAGFALTSFIRRRIDLKQAFLRGCEALPAGLLFLQMSTGRGSNPTNHPFSLTTKLFGIAKAFTSGTLAGDAAFAMGGVSFLLLVVLSSRLRFARLFVPGLVGLATLYFVLPANMASGSYVDARMPIAIAIMMLAGLDVRFQPRKSSVALMVLLGGAIVVKQAAITVLWLSFTDPVERLVKQMRPLTAHGIIMESECLPPSNDVLGVYRSRQPAMQHIAALSNFDNSRFVASVYAISGQQPIGVAPAYQSYYQLQTSFSPTCASSEYLKRLSKIETVSQTMAQAGKQIPPLFFFLVRPPEPAVLQSKAKLLFTGPSYALYQVSPARVVAP